MRRPVVVKFGGSLIGSPERGALLASAARCGAIVAPGGGPYADAVREAERREGFDGDHAHRRAILAMDRTAAELGHSAPSLRLVESFAGFLQSSKAAEGVIWRPSPLALKADLPRSWDVTSDSLALWLAIELGAARLVLLKSATVNSASGPGEWARAGLVDAHFPVLAKRFAGDVVCIGPASARRLDRALAAPLKAAA